MSSEQLENSKLLPGSFFPSIEVDTIDGQTVNLQANGNVKLIVVYRFNGCPFCLGKYIKFVVFISIRICDRYIKNS